MKKRNREFHDVRVRNIALKSSPNSFYQNGNITTHNQKTGINQYLTSSTKQLKPNVCVSCVNKNIIHKKKAKQVLEKTKEIQQSKKERQKINLLIDSFKDNQQKMEIQAYEYNKKLMNNHRQTIKSEKMMDSKYIQSITEKQKKILEQERYRHQKQKQNELQYRKQLYLQLKQQQQKRARQKIQKQKLQTNQLNIKQYYKSNMIKNYSTQLKRQINSRNLIKQIQRQKKIQEEKKILQMSEKQFQKHIQFEKKSQMNPEFFSDIKSIDYKKKITNIQQREMKYKERLQMQIREKELNKSETEKALKQKKEYKRNLNEQMTQRYLKKVLEKEQDRNYQWKFKEYTQDVLQQTKIMKPCKQCNKSYQEICFI